MLINNNILDRLCEDAGEARTQKAIRYKNSNRVRIIEEHYINQNNFEIRAEVTGTISYRTYISIKDGEVEDVNCDCPDYYNHYGVCKHTLASVLEYKDRSNVIKSQENNILKGMSPNHVVSNTIEHRNFKQIVNTFYNEELDKMDAEKIVKNKENIKLQPIIFYDKFTNELKAEFKIGNKKMYKLKDLSEFYTRMINEEFYKYGEKLQFVHTKEVFDEDSKKLLDFVLKYAEIIKYANSNSNSNYRYYGKALNETNIMLGNSGVDEIFEILKGKTVEFQRDNKKEKIEFTDEQPKIEFKLKKISDKEYTIIPNIEIYNVSIIKGKEYKYILLENKLYRCNKEFENSNLKLLELFRQNYITELTLGEEDLYQLFSIIMPKIKNAIKIEEIEQNVIEKYKPKKLIVKVFLDFDEHDYLVADIKFCYDNTEFNPLDNNVNVDIPRNVIEETKALNIFRKTGFMLETKKLRFILPKNDQIYQFLTEDINEYMQKFEVLATDNFKTKEIRQPKLGNLGVKVENDLLSINLENMDIDINE